MRAGKMKNGVCAADRSGMLAVCGAFLQSLLRGSEGHAVKDALEQGHGLVHVAVVDYVVQGDKGISVLHQHIAVIERIAIVILGAANAVKGRQPTVVSVTS